MLNFLKKSKNQKTSKINEPGLVDRFLIAIQKKLEKANLSHGQIKAVVCLVDFAINLVVIFFVTIFIQSFIFRPFIVYGSSMCDTLNFIDDKCQERTGEFLLINKSSYLKLFGFELGTPQRGDIIVFHPPQYKNTSEAPFIKRVIGLPGETVKLIDGFVYIYNDEHPQGIKLDEPYLNETNRGNTQPMDKDSTTIFYVPEGKYFVLGDNRTRSSDSRLCFQKTLDGEGCGTPGITPFIGIEDMEGKAATSFWPKPHLLYTAQYPELE